MTGFWQKLRAERKAQEKQGLVWVGDAELHGFYRARHPHVAHTRLEGHGQSEARHHGQQAGRSLVIHKPVQGQAGSRGRLLGPGGRG